MRSRVVRVSPLATHRRRRPLALKAVPWCYRELAVPAQSRDLVEPETVVETDES